MTKAQKLKTLNKMLEAYQNDTISSYFMCHVLNEILGLQSYERTLAHREILPELWKDRIKSNLGIKEFDVNSSDAWYDSSDVKIRMKNIKRTIKRLSKKV